MIKYFFTVIVLSLLTCNLIAGETQALADKELEQILKELDWKYEGIHSFQKSNSSFQLPEDHSLVLGEDANKFEMVFYGASPSSNIEAVVYNCEDHDRIIFEYFNDGYVTLDDWNEIDPNELINSISIATENANHELKKQGFEEIHTVGWVQEPTFDHNTNTVNWIVEVKADGNIEHSINAIAFRLGRYGYEKVTWVTSKSLYSPYGSELKKMLNAHGFNEGYRYEDYTYGDTISSYGIKALITASAGGTAIKYLGLLGFLKKFIYFIFAGVAAVFYKIKKLFSRKKAPAPT